MKLEYNEGDDTLLLSLDGARVVRDVSQNGHVSVRYCASGVAQVSIQAASKVGVWPVKRVGSQPKDKGRNWRDWDVYFVLLGLFVLVSVLILVTRWPNLHDAEVALTPRACILLERAGAPIEAIGAEQGCTVRVEYSGSALQSSLLRFEHGGRKVEVNINPTEVLSVTYF